MIDRRNQSEVKVVERPVDAGHSPATGAKRILVVDDEPMIRRLIDRVLSTIEGHSVGLAGDGQTAWLMLQEKRYDCVIMDWNMPGMSGKQLYELIEGSYSEMASRCLFISGHATTAEVKSFASVNGNPILQKPFSIDQLRQETAKIVGVNQPQQ